MLEQDANNYLRFEFRSNSVGVFAAAWKILSGVGSSAIAEKAVSLGSANNYLRLTRSGNTYTLDYSQDGSSYTSAGSFTLSGFAPAKAGLYVINAGSNSQTTAKFDYFKISGSVAARQDGVCGETRNSCNPGTFIDVDDSLTQYLWTCNGNGVGGATNDPCSLTIPVNPLTYTLSTPTPSNGSISKSPNQTTFNQDDRVTLTATPNSGYQFGSWSGDASGTVNPLDIIMNGNKSITAIFTQIVTPPSGNTFYIRDGATSSSCTDWTNACDSLPGTLQRGATYYIADGSYGSYTFDDPVFGTQLITIKKATASDHGTNTGWSSSYGSGQAVFGGTLNFNTSYWVFDGQTGGGPGSWKTGHGFKIEVLTTESGMGISVERNMHDITLKRFEVQGNGGDGGGSGTPNDAVVLKDNGYNINISYAYLHDMGRTIFFIGADNVRIEYTYTGWYESVSAQHSALASIWRGVATIPPDWSPVRNITFANNVFGGVYGTGGIIMQGDGLDVYGNVFYRPAGQTYTVGNGAVGTWGSSALLNARVYNNTFIDLQEKSAIGGLNNNDTVIAYNNIFYKSAAGSGAVYDYNNYLDILDSLPSDSHARTGTGDPFVDYLNLDFRLKTATPSGAPLSFPYNLDMFGNVSVADGTWDRGAVEFTGPVSPSAPSITVQPSSQSVPQTQSATFTVSASGYPTPSIQWQKGTTNLSNAG